MEPERKWLLDGKSHLTRRVVTSHNHTPDSSAIPEGTQIYVPPYSLHRDPRYFSPAPDAFKPERWLDDNDKTLKKNEIQGYRHLLSFSDGPRICLGKSFALAEFKVRSVFRLCVTGYLWCVVCTVCFVGSRPEL